MSAEGITRRSIAGGAPASAAQEFTGRVRSAGRQGGFRSLIIAVAIPLIAGSAVGMRYRPDDWYTSLKQPVWLPPTWIFGTVWTFVYSSMGLASWLVWAKGGWKQQARPLAIYVAQLALHLLWPFTFFGLHQPGLALGVIILTGIAASASLVAFKPVNHVAANLIKPYLVWILFAGALNFNVWKHLHNPVTTVVDLHSNLLHVDSIANATARIAGV